MGFSVSGSHVIFFIAALIVAGAVSGVFVAITLDVSSSINERGERFQEQLDTDFKIINDPDNIPSDNSDYFFYIKNIGGCTIITSTSTFQVFVDGEIIGTSDYSFDDTSITPTSVTTLNIDKGQIGNGDHTMVLVGPQAIKDTFEFTI